MVSKTQLIKDITNKMKCSDLKTKTSLGGRSGEVQCDHPKNNGLKVFSVGIRFSTVI